MSAVHRSSTAPRIVRGMGCYALLLSLSYAIFLAIVLGIYEQPSIYNIVGIAVFLASGIGLIFRRRWAYATALVFSAFALFWQIRAFVLWRSDQGDTESLQVPFFWLTFVGVALPLLLLRSDSLRWFLSQPGKDE